MNLSSDQSLFLNLNVRGIQPSSTLRINELSNQLRDEGRDIYKLGLGQSPFPVPERVVKSLQDNAHQKDYLPVKGLKPLRQAVSDYLRRTQHLESSAEDIMIGPGSKELLFILQLAYYGDLLIPRPSWVSYAPQARIIGRSVHWLPTHADTNWQLTAEELDIVCRDDPTRPRILILNYPSNPTGCTYSDEHLQALAEVARRYRIILLSDEIYGDLHFEGQHKSIARFYPEGTIVSTGLSKWCGAGGWRLGVFMFPQELRGLQEAMAVIASETYTATSAPIQHAAIAAFQGGEDIDRYLLHSRRILKAVGVYLHQRLADMNIRASMPQGGFYLLPDFQHYRQALARHDILTSTALCTSLLETTGVAMLPGVDFGLAPDQLFARIAFVDFDGEAALQRSMNLHEERELDSIFVQLACPRLCRAFDKLEDWLGQL